MLTEIQKSEILEKVYKFLESDQKPLEKYPGVTKILGATKDDTFLIQWRERIGDEEADRIVEESKKIGTSLDSLVMQYLDKEKKFLQEEYVNEPGYDLFRQLKQPLTRVEPIALQMKVWSDKLKVMGFLDILAFMDGELTLIDIKNTKKTKKRAYVEDYFLQCTMYCMMLHDLLGIEVKRIALLIADRSNTVPQIFVERTSTYVRQAIRRVHEYHGSFGSNFQSGKSGATPD